MKQFNVVLCTLLATASVGAGGTAHANLLTNGSFEQGTFTNEGSDTQTFNAGATTMTGWIVVGDQLSWIGAANPFGLAAQDGAFFLDLTAYITGAPFGGVTQTIATTAGEQYELSFYLGSYTARWGGPPVSIVVSANGASQTFTNSASTSSSTWTRETLLFTAGQGNSTAITLTGAAGAAYIGLDDVAVVCANPETNCSGVSPVPEPGSLALLGLGLAGLGLTRRRRERSRA